LLPDCQSAYRAHHSTETAILKVMSDILSALDSGDLALLTLLDLSAVFDMVDHVILLQRRKTSYDIRGQVLGWLTCYLSNRTQFVQRGSTRSKPSAVICGFAVYHTVRFSDRSCFCFTPQTSLDWRLRTVSMFISMRMTRKCMAPAIQTV